MGELERNGLQSTPEADLDVRVKCVRLGEKRLLSTADAAAYFGVSARTIRRWNGAGLLYPVRIRRSCFYVPSDINAIVQARLVAQLLAPARDHYFAEQVNATEPGSADDKPLTSIHDSDL